ncbi:hypothetical protein [Streptomyces sp. NPDC058398]|uniref:hypothetical protein n=1 Tax=Streptomyces sp. NPDC058398 TaxID=3346479 RepID=UPI003667FA15
MTTNPQQPEPWWTADGRLKPHALPTATVPDQPSMTGGFDDSIEIPDLPAVSVPASAPRKRSVCGECGHAPTAHTEGEDPVSPGVCADCPDGEDTHDYLPPRGAADGNESTAGPDAHTDQADELRPLRIPDHTVNEEQGVLHEATDQAALRERIAEALYAHDHPGWRVSLRESDTEPVYQTRAAAVLPLFAGHDSPAAVLPVPADRAAIYAEVAERLAHVPFTHVLTELRRLAAAVPVSGPGGGADETQQAEPVDRAAVLHATADAYDAILAKTPDKEADPRYWSGVHDVVIGLRSLAGEARQPEAQPAPSVEHCIHDRTVHRTHHKPAPVVGCPWCATTQTATQTDGEA